MGDGVIKLPFLRALRAAFPAARITWLAGKGRTVYAGALAPLVRGLLDEVIEDADIGRRWWPPWQRPLSGRRFDLVIDTQRRVRTSIVVRRIRHGAFVSGALGWALSDRLPPRGRAKPAAMLRQLLDLVEAASGAPARFDAPLPADPASTAEAERLLPPGPVYVGLAPGAGGEHKRWPLASFLALGEAQLAAGRAPVFLLGPAERDWLAEIVTCLPQAILPLGDDPSPMLTVAVARRLAVAIANDSGTGHLLAAAETPLVSLFGPTDPAKFAPFAPRLTIVRAQEFGSDAMEDIPLAAVAEAVEGMIEGFATSSFETLRSSG